MFNYSEVIFGTAENSASGWKRRFFKMAGDWQKLKI